MKLEVSNRRLKNEAGSVLATTLIITFLLGATLISFLMLAQHQVFANARSQSWNHSMAVTESGVEDAMQLINRYAHDPTQLLNWAGDISSGTLKDGWEYIGNDTFRTYRVIGNPATAVYRVYVTNSNPSAPYIRATGYLLYKHGYAAPVTVSSVGTVSTGFETVPIDRDVVVGTRRDALWTLAMLADRQIDLNGNNIETDSFNSADPNASAWNAAAGFGTYDPSKRTENGDVATNDRIINSLNVGNAKIIGNVSTGPGGSIAIGANGSVGSAAWVTSGNTGIQDGHSSDDMNVRLENVTLPPSTWFGLPTLAGAGTNINGTTYKHVITDSRDYYASTLQGSVYIGPGVEARLHLTDDVSLGGQQEIRIHAAATGLMIFMEGESFKLAGNGVANETGRANAFLYFGLETNTQLVFQGNGDFTGAIYAPYANFVLGGGGAGIFDFIGASVTHTVTMNGKYRFHFDEDLANWGPSRGFIPTSWAEL